MTTEKPPDAHINSMSVFDCPRVYLVRDAELGTLTIVLGGTVINVYGHDPYDIVPEVLEAETETRAKVRERKLREFTQRVEEFTQGGDT